MSINEQREMAFNAECAQKTQLEVPGKTFLVGEYTATQGGPSLIFTSRPLFKLLIEPKASDSCLSPFHPQSPAGQWYEQYRKKLAHYRFSFINPYNVGGLGASTAEFLSLYRFSLSILKQTMPANTELVRLYQSLCKQQGTLPSGADLIAQQHRGISFYFPQQGLQSSSNWPFEELSLLLFHTNHKLATHEHLKELPQQQDYTTLADIALTTCKAFQNKDRQIFIEAITAFAKELKQQQLVSPYTNRLLEKLSTSPEVLAAKGCGALGSDVILVLCCPHNQSTITALMQTFNCPLIASDKELAL